MVLCWQAEKFTYGRFESEASCGANVNLQSQYQRKAL